MEARKYEIEEQSMMLGEPAVAYGRRINVRSVARYVPLHAGSEERFAKMRDFCRSHFPEYIWSDLERHNYMIDQPQPADEETEEAMWERIERESQDEENYVTFEEFKSIANAWDEWRD